MINGSNPQDTAANPLRKNETEQALARQVLVADSLDIDWESIHQQLLVANGNVTKVRQLLEAGNVALIERFVGNHPVSQLVRERARLVDTVIADTWQRVGGNFADLFILAAVGGYGRNELHLYSDVDLLLLVPSERKARAASDEIAAFLAFLWDVGMEVGHSTRTVGECRSESEHDISIATTLMESRLIVGPEKLFENI